LVVQDYALLKGTKRVNTI